MLQASGYLSETRPKIYGIEFSSYASGIESGSTSALSTKGIRLYDSVGYRFVRGSLDSTVVDSFIQNEGSPFDIHEVVTAYDTTKKVQKVVARDTDATWNTVKNNSSYNRMIEFPLFYYNRPSRYEFRISDDLINGYLPSPMHYRNNKIYKHVYITKYALDSEYMSRSGASPLTNVEAGTIRTNLASKGIHMLDYNTYMGLLMLMYIKYGNLNLQSVIGNGTNDASSIPVNGEADDVLGLDGGAGLKSSNSSIVTLGIENLWGKLHHYIDGLNIAANGTWINEVIDNHSDTSKYSLADAVLTNDLTLDHPYVKELAYKEAYPWSLHPSDLVATENPSFESITSGGPLSMLFNNTMSATTGALGFAFVLDEEVVDKNVVIQDTTE